MYPDTPYFIILLCLIAENIIRQFYSSIRQFNP